MKSMQQLFSRENHKTFLIWNVGAFITAVGAYFFKYPNHFSFGGVSGITVVLGHYFPELSLGGINWVLNLALLVLGAVMLGKSFGVSTAYVTVSMSAFLSLFEVLFPMSQPLTDQPPAGTDLRRAAALGGCGSAVQCGRFHRRHRHHRHDPQEVHQR